MRSYIFASFLILGCSSDLNRRPPGGGSDLSGNFGDGFSGDNCSASARLVYVVDQANGLSSFAPDTLTFTSLGTLACPATGGATPFSMAVDRSATAWVLYSSGELFRVDTSSLQCTKSAFANSGGFVNFGMGFSVNASGSTDETLFIAGGAAGSVGMGSASLASLDLTSFNTTKLGTITGWPELTGTGDANLWGFFPNVTPPKVEQLDKTNAGILKTLPAPSLQGTPTAWAFAFWGGDFWIFLQKNLETETTVYHLKSADGSVSPVVTNTGRTIVGAGVSTCAPVTIM